MLPNRWSFSFSACADFDCSSLLPPYIMYYNIGLTICQHFMQRSIEKHPSCDRCFSERYAYEIKYIHQMTTIWCNWNGRTWTLDTLDISQLLYQWATFRKLTKIKVWQRSPSYRIKRRIRIAFMRTRSLLFSLPNVWLENHSQLKPYQCRPLYFHHTMPFPVDYRNYHHIQLSKMTQVFQCFSIAICKHPLWENSDIRICTV